jgi:low affinity Fe/Cu permease
MAKSKKNNTNGKFEKLANRATQATGSTTAFLIAVSAIIIWGFSGFIFNFSDTWQLVINTGTTIITFLMVFLIQKTQNKDGLAIQLKLNELVAAHEAASNRMVNVEDMTEEELQVLRKYYSKLSIMAEKDETVHQSHSIEEAREKHMEKKEKQND